MERLGETQGGKGSPGDPRREGSAGAAPGTSTKQAGEAAGAQVHQQGRGQQDTLKGRASHPCKLHGSAGLSMHSAGATEAQGAESTTSPQEKGLLELPLLAPRIHTRPWWFPVQELRNPLVFSLEAWLADSIFGERLGVLGAGPWAAFYSPVPQLPVLPAPLPLQLALPAL